MTIPVSEIHAAGGLAKWVRKNAHNAEISHTDERRREKMKKTATDTGKQKNEPQSRKTNVPTEHEEQVAFVGWARMWLPENLRGLLFAIPNGGKRNVVVAMKMKAEGVVPGVPDLFFSWPRMGKHGLFIEMKRKKGGAVKVDQKNMLATLKKAGYAVCVARGCEEAQNALRRYMFGAEWTE